MSQPNLAVVEGVTTDEETTKEQYVINYLKSMVALEEAMEPFKEQKKELRVEYVENGWLTKDDIWSAVKAFRLYRQAADLDELNDMFDLIERQFGSTEGALTFTLEIDLFLFRRLKSHTLKTRCCLQSFCLKGMR